MTEREGGREEEVISEWDCTELLTTHDTRRTSSDIDAQKKTLRSRLGFIGNEVYRSSNAS